MTTSAQITALNQDPRRQIQPAKHGDQSVYCRPLGPESVGRDSYHLQRQGHRAIVIHHVSSTYHGAKFGISRKIKWQPISRAFRKTASVCITDSQSRGNTSCLGFDVTRLRLSNQRSERIRRSGLLKDRRGMSACHAQLVDRGLIGIDDACIGHDATIPRRSADHVDVEIRPTE